MRAPLLPLLLLPLALACAGRGGAAGIPADEMARLGSDPALAPVVEASPAHSGMPLTRLVLAESSWVAVVADLGGRFELWYPADALTRNRWRPGVHQDAAAVPAWLPSTDRAADCAAGGDRARGRTCDGGSWRVSQPRQIVYVAARDTLRFVDMMRALKTVEPLADQNETLSRLAEALDGVANGRRWGATVVRNPAWKPTDYQSASR